MSASNLTQDQIDAIFGRLCKALPNRFEQEISNMMKHKNVQLITIFSLIACVLHATILHTPFNAYVYTSAFKVIVFILCPVIYYKVAKEGSFKELLSLFSMHGDRKNIKLALLLGLSVFTFIVVVFIILRPFFDRAVVVDALAENGITSNNAMFVFLYIVVINAALEQLFFRGFVFMSLYRMNFKRYAHIYSSVLFSFYHIPILINAVSLGILILCTVGLIVAGLIFNALAAKFQSISGSLIVHISANLALNMMISIFFVF